MKVNSQEMSNRNRSWTYWVRLSGFVVVAFYGAFIAGFAWLNAGAMIRPAQHRICCGSPDDFGAKYEPVKLVAADGARLAGWYIPSQNRAAVILLHGYGGDRLGTLVYAKMLYQHGYGVLLYDQRASGESEGETLSWGWRDVADVAAALAYLRERAEVEPDRLGVLGCSTGAEIAINAGAQFPELRAVIADAPYYATARDAWPPYEVADWLGWPVYPMLITFMEWRSGASAPLSLSEAVTRLSPRPLLLIAAGREGYEQWQAQRFYKLAGAPKDYWVVPEASHCGGPSVQPEEYEKRIITFFDQALLER